MSDVKPVPLRAGLAIAVLLPLAGLGIGLYAVSQQMKVRGELTIERGAGGAVAIQPRRCAAGEPLGFKGARLEGTEGRGLAISVREAELRIEGAGPVALILTPANCPGLAIHVDELRDEDGNLIDVDGFVRLGRDHQSFGRVGGRLEFANCH